MDVVDEYENGSGGPMWVGKIIQKRVIPTDCEGKLGKFFEIMSKEAEGPPGLYDINDLSRSAKIGQTPQRNKIIRCLEELGYFASSSIFSPLGIKTDAPEAKRLEATELAQSL